MASYHVQRAPEHRFSRLYVSAAVLVLAAIMAVGVPSFSRVDIVVDGTPRSLPQGSVAHDIVERGWAAAPGNVLDAEGRVVAEGKGGPVVLMRGGVELGRDEALADGYQIVTQSGADVTESEITTRVPIPIEVEYQGKGPLLALESPGAVGVEERVVGEYSGIVVTSTVLVQSQPMVVRRFMPRVGAKVVALTFDDGPWPGQTDRILDILKKEKVRATFFMVGRQVYANRFLARRVLAEGHLIGNHTQGHKVLNHVTPAEARTQIADGQTAIQQVIGIRSHWFRPPGGGLTPTIGGECSRFGMRLAMWTVDPQDWRQPRGGTLVAALVRTIKPGSIVLLHDGGGNRKATIDALPAVIHELKRQGYTFVTLDEMAAMK